MDKKTYNTLGIIVWWIFAITIGLTYYVNYHMPHGPMINTGYDCVEYNDGRSSACGDQYVEDTRNLNIPDWAKFLREYFLLVLIGESALAVYLQIKGGKEFRE
ncbi:MAG: hypothetical protein WC870_03090 [Candidatus Paceibacterota bacterium]